MKLNEFLLLVIVVAVPLVFVGYIGMTKEDDHFLTNGWFFAPFRWLKRFGCGMFVGHKWKNIGNGNKICIHCLKKGKIKHD